MHHLYVDNERTSGHVSLVFGMRELNASESDEHCNGGGGGGGVDMPIFDTAMVFSANFELRSYLSGCYYLDAKKVWRWDGLLVSVWMLEDIDDACLM
jgi:hypothetical protein